VVWSSQRKVLTPAWPTTEPSLRLAWLHLLSPSLSSGKPPSLISSGEDVIHQEPRSFTFHPALAPGFVPSASVLWVCKPPGIGQPGLEKQPTANPRFLHLSQEHVLFLTLVFRDFSSLPTRSTMH
jgi:hypothetical protein